MKVIIDIFKEIAQYIYMSNHLTFWVKTLKEFLLYYSKALFDNAKQLFKEVGDIIYQMKKDKFEISNAYKEFIPKDKLDEELMFFDHLIEFLDVSSTMISFSCSKLRKFLGPSFSLSTAKMLINLRFDLEEEDKKEALVSCKEVLDNFTNDDEHSKQLIQLVGKDNILRIFTR